MTSICVCKVFFFWNVYLTVAGLFRVWSLSKNITQNLWNVRKLRCFRSGSFQNAGNVFEKQHACKSKNDVLLETNWTWSWKYRMSRLLTTANGSFPASKQEFHEISLEFTCFGEKHYVRFSAPLLLMISVTCPERGNLRDPCRLGSLKLSQKQFANVLGNWWKVASASNDDHKTKQVMILWCSAHLCYVYN